ncbi:hypothetical protein CHELA1G11_40057 [Hyphomicrobiales bacterium]|nr:hypothetical protein CHELA1G11_40057 [Hyphomicrobiales bacterium]CAH1696474.1 hypothetical protein CHELA1G2_40084 [Hyphomicrobiales bacterium]
MPARSSKAGRPRRSSAAPDTPKTTGLMRCLPSNARSGEAHLATIRGTVPSLLGELRGCRFRERCDLARPACDDDIALLEHPGGHLARCIVTAEETSHASGA